MLHSYDIEHRAATRPLYEATRLIAGLYGNDRLPARVLRKFALGLGRRAAPFRRLVMAGLTQDGGDMPFGGVRRAWVRLRPR